MTEEIRNILLGAFVLALAITAAWPVRAQDHHRWHQYYKDWKQPGTDIGCCNARVAAPFGGETGDCEPSKAEVLNGNWWVWIRQIGQWKRVPDEKILREKNPNVFDAHVCFTEYQGIICFVPPDTGG